MNIGYKIKELRLGRSMTQEQLADYLSVSAQCISKWENNVTTPDIQMLPLISAFFGVTIDELFNLSDDDYLCRIDAMLEHEKMLDLEEFNKAEAFLLKKEQTDADNDKYPMMLAGLYNHMADGYRSMAEEKSKRAIYLSPEKKCNHTLLRMAQAGSQMDWNFENHSKRIDFYKEFVTSNPKIERGYVSLLDELIAANRFDEAKKTLAIMEANIHTLRPLFYKGYLLWVMNLRKEAEEVWSDMLERYADEWLGYALLGDCMANFCEYERAIYYYERSLELQEKPRYTDSQISIAMIYEILGRDDDAAKAWENVLDILMNEHKITEGRYIDEIQAEIMRLNRKGKYD